MRRNVPKIANIKPKRKREAKEVGNPWAKEELMEQMINGKRRKRKRRRRKGETIVSTSEAT